MKPSKVPVIFITAPCRTSTVELPNAVKVRICPPTGGLGSMVKLSTVRGAFFRQVVKPFKGSEPSDFLEGAATAAKTAVETTNKDANILGRKGGDRVGRKRLGNNRSVLQTQA